MSGDIDDFRGLLAKVGNGETLSIDEAERAFDIMTSGDATPAQSSPPSNLSEQCKTGKDANDVVECRD